MPERAYVVTRPFPTSGLGSNLASMAGAWELARRLDRELIVDWRGMVFLEDSSLNYFTEFFTALPELDGVRFHYAPSAEAGDHLEAGEDDRREVTAGDHLRLVAAGSDALPPYLVLTQYHGLERLGPASHFLLRRFYRALELRPEVQAKADAFYDDRLADAFVVGINIATGNAASPTGRYWHGRFDTRLFENRERFLRRVDAATKLAVRRLPPELRNGRRVFYTSDSAWMSQLLGQLSDSHTRRTVFPPPEGGRFFSDYRALGYSDRDASVDMVVDHFLLSRCDALIYNGSMFSNYARVSTNYFAGNCRYVESMYAGYWAKAVLRRLRR